MKHGLKVGIAILLFAVPVQAQEQMSHMDMDKDAKIESAMSAAPLSIAQDATIRDWPANPGEEMPLLKEGSNEFTCLPNMPDTPGNDPMCLDEPWMQWAEAWMNKEDVNITQIGFGYMLQGGTPESNTDPYAEGPTEDNEWMTDPVPHLMIIVPDPEMLEGLPETPDSGGPWVMWRDTPYVHIMAPMPKHNPTTMTQ
ncbi:hypothetical protein [Fodinibius salsisoli]|uniref:Uncharacterized protein n=1 Tax=Fodinibius salsisoli TaxID=2820877 RepID=A0ABT3PQA6_9BACT|nr:hypothetical protein [Fodinibius salsisoli]MCW9708040.1 hypothetical protein [Fodinibius salsisoli]